MEKQKFDLKKYLQKMKPADYIYLSVMFVFFIIIAVLFSISTNFIVSNINKIFSPIKAGNSQALNIGQYSLVAKKLNLPVNTVTPDNGTASTTPTPATTPIVPVSPTPSQVLDKKSITIEILNSTTKKGVASVLNKSLTLAGFSSATTGNEKTSYDITTIVINDKKKDYSSLLLEAVNKIYPKAVTQILPNKTGTDVTIIIGKQ